MQYLDSYNLSAAVIIAGCRIISVSFALLMLLSVITLLLSAFYFLISGGREEQAMKAKGFFVYSIIGIVLALLAPSILSVIASFFGLPSPVSC